MPGICTSMQITSGRRADAAATASAPVRRLADHDDVAGRLEDRAEAGAHHGVVVDQEDPDHRRPGARPGSSSGTRRAPGTRRARGGRSRSSRPTRPRARACRAARARAAARATRPPGVDDLELDEPVVGVAQPHLGGRARTAVPAGVGERLLGDPVQVHLRSPAGPARGSPTTVNVVGRPAASDAAASAGSASSPIVDGCGVVGGARRAQRVQQPVQLVDRLAGGLPRCRRAGAGSRRGRSRAPPARRRPARPSPTRGARRRRAARGRCAPGPGRRPAPR